MDELEKRIIEFAQKAGTINQEDDEAARKFSAEAQEIMELIRNDTAPAKKPDLFSIIPRSVIEERLRRIENYSGLAIIDSEFLKGGAYRLNLAGQGRRAEVIVKKADGAGFDFGARLARAAGLESPEIHLASDFMLIEEIGDFEGKEITAGLNGKKILVSAAGTLHEAIAEGGAGRLFWRTVSGKDGRKKFFSAWLDYIELCRICLLGDRHHRNGAIAFGKSEIAILPIDTDAVAFRIMIIPGGEALFGVYYNQFALDSAMLIKEISARSAEHSAYIPPDVIFDEYNDLLEERLLHDFAALQVFREKIISEIRNPANLGIGFGIANGHSETFGGMGFRKFEKTGRFSADDAILLENLVKKLCTEEERKKFIRSQIRCLRTFARIRS